jgi:hypothetical protein
MNDRIEIQAQDTSGMWRTYHVTMNDSQRILAEMRSIQSRYPNYRVRAVDQNGRVVDIL